MRTPILRPSRAAALRRLVLAALLALSAAPAAADSGYVVIVNAGNPATAASRREVSRWFLRQASAWGDGARVAPVDQPKSSPVREAFTREVLGRSVDAVSSYWVQAIYSGREVPPPEKMGDAEVVAYVRATPGGIGYVSPGAALDGVKRLAIKD